MNKLEGRTAIVTGGATLIGEYVAMSLLEAGANVVLADINTIDGEAVAARLGPKTNFIEADVPDDVQFDQCIEMTIAEFGGLDILVNVAVTYTDEGLASTRDEWLDAINCNVVGAAIFVQKAAPHIKRQGGGAIVNFASISGKIAQPGRMLYSVSKAAILGMTRNMAAHLAPDNIRVNSVSPGWTWSNVIRDMSGNDRERADRVAAPLHLIGRLVEPAEVGRTVAFLCADESSGITGTDIAIDGGYTAIGAERTENLVAQLGH